MVADQYGTPTSTLSVVRAIERIIRDPVSIETGIHHIADHTEHSVSWYEFAREIARLSGHDPDKVRPCVTHEYPVLAPRPRSTPLRSASWIEARDWREMLADFISSQTN